MGLTFTCMWSEKASRETSLGLVSTRSSYPSQLRNGIEMGDWMASWLIEGIGIAAGVIGVLAWGPQIVEVWKHKRHDGISLPTFSIVAFSLSLWLIYGIAIKSTAMIFANILTLSVIAIIIIGVVRIRKSE